MARYTGPNNKKARRVSFSILEMVKILQKDLMVQDNMVKTEKENLLTMLFS